jgi:nucleotide exchange factor SIL1
MTFITHVLLLVVLLNLHLPLTHSAEFIPSTSWQVLPPEDSVPAGLHIRVDMETGQRWAKIAVEGDEDLITTREQVEGMRTGSSGGGGGARGGGSTAMIVGGDGETDEEDDNFDYDLMYRTYERIPEKDRPDLPDRSDPKFKVVMRDLWDKRQAQLADAISKMADMPTVLESLIKSLTVPEERSMALSELAYLLSDIDIARDFYILNGWVPLLRASQDTSVTETDRAVAVMAMGTAVRNNVEFYHWADEDTMNAVLTNIMLAKEQGAVVKALGGLGSLIRGNDIGREVWRDIGGEKGVKDIAMKWGHDVR